MNPPPPELQWTSIVASAIASLVAVVSLGVNIFILWQNRRRLDFRVIGAAVYFQEWKNHELPDPNVKHSEGSIRAPIKAGDYKSFVVVAEFAIRNEYPTEVTVGRFAIDEWMFVDRYQPEMYAKKQDYRVFDLYTRAQISLDRYVKVPPKGSLGLRIEVFEQTEGPEWRSSKTRYTVNLPKEYSVEFYLENQKLRRRIRFRRYEEGSMDYSMVDRWSTNLLPPAQRMTANPRPLGVEYRKYGTPWHIRFMNWRRSAFVWLMYGGYGAYYAQPRRTRLQQLIQRLRSRRAKG